MDAIVKMLEKHQPFFEKISRNIYLQAIKDGFLGCMPIVLTSSIFLLIATLPGVVGITLPQPLIDWCNKLYNFTMGVMGIGQNFSGVFGTLITSLFVDNMGTWQSVTIPNAIFMVLGVVCAVALVRVMKKQYKKLGMLDEAEK